MNVPPTQPRKSLRHAEVGFGSRTLRPERPARDGNADENTGPLVVGWSVRRPLALWDDRRTRPSRARRSLKTATAFIHLSPNPAAVFLFRAAGGGAGCGECSGWRISPCMLSPAASFLTQNRRLRCHNCLETR